MDLYSYDKALLLHQFWWWLELSGAQEDQKTMEKKTFLVLLWLLDPLICTKRSLKNFKIPSCMATRFGHLNTKFAVDSTNPAQLIARGVRKSMGFLRFFLRKIFFWCHWMASFFSHISRIDKFPLVATHNLGKFGADPKSGSEFQKEFSLTGFKKCPFSNSFFSFRN